MPKQPTDPDFPHGTIRGYVDGCHRGDPCPAVPSCADVKRDTQRDLARRNGHNRYAEHPDWPQTFHVQRRLRETIEKAGADALHAHANVNAEQVQAVLEHDQVTIDPALAEPLDHAWSLLIKGTDTLAADFEHGRTTAYTRYHCRCGRCRRAAATRQAQIRAGHQTDHTLVHVPRLRAHVESLVKATGGTIWPVVRASGVAKSSVAGALAGDRVRIRVARKLLSTTPADAARAAKLVPARTAYLKLRQMWALGYSVSWLAEQIDSLGLRQAMYMRPDSWVTVDAAEAIIAFAEKVGDTPATPQGTLTEKAIKQARAHARRRGFYPPVFYDDDGNLDYRAIPEHPWSKADERCAKDFALVYAVARGNRSAHQLVNVERIAHDRKSVDRMRKRLRVTSIFNEETKESALAPECVERAAWVRSMIEDYEAGLRGPVEVALTIGSRDPKAIPKDHPELIAWKAAGLLAWVMFTRDRVAALVARHTPQYDQKEAA